MDFIDLTPLQPLNSSSQFTTGITWNALNNVQVIIMLNKTYLNNSKQIYLNCREKYLNHDQIYRNERTDISSVADALMQNSPRCVLPAQSVWRVNTFCCFVGQL